MSNRFQLPLTKFQLCPANSVIVITVLQGRVAPRRRNYWRAREVPELLHGIIGLGKSVILTDSGHRVASGKSQDMTIEPYILVGLNGIYRDYLYGIYRAGKLIKSLTATISAQFFT